MVFSSEKWYIVYIIPEKKGEKLVDYLQSFTFKLMQKLLKIMDICLNT